MPHFGLMEERKLGPVDGPLQRARLHLRSGKRRLRQGKISAGIVTLYDAVLGAMESCSERNRQRLVVLPGEDLRNDAALYRILRRSRFVSGRFDFESFERLEEQALGGDMAGFEWRELVAGIDALMAELEVEPFDESALPAEDPAVF